MLDFFLHCSYVLFLLFFLTAVKCNPDPHVLKLLAGLNLGFDCASKVGIKNMWSKTVRKGKTLGNTFLILGKVVPGSWGGGGGGAIPCVLERGCKLVTSKRKKKEKNFWKEYPPIPTFHPLRHHWIKISILSVLWIKNMYNNGHTAYDISTVISVRGDWHVKYSCR